MEYITVHIEAERFKLPISYERLNKLVLDKLKINPNELESISIAEYLENENRVLRNTNSPFINCNENKTNIFVLNAYLSLLKPIGSSKIKLNEHIQTDTDSLLLEFSILINEALETDLMFDLKDLIEFMDNNEYIEIMVAKEKASALQRKRKAQERTSLKKTNKGSKFTIEMLRARQNEIDEEQKKK